MNFITLIQSIRSEQPRGKDISTPLRGADLLSAEWLKHILHYALVLCFGKACEQEQKKKTQEKRNWLCIM